MVNISPEVRAMLQKVLLNEWSDEARKKSAEKRRQKAQQKGSWLKTAGKIGLIGAGAVAGGLIGGRTLPRLIGKGRLAQAGENLIGKTVYTTPPKALAGHEGWSIGSVIPVGGKRNLSKLLKEQAQKKGIRGRVASRLSKAEQWLGVPERHFGVGERGGKVSHYSPEGVHSESRGKFGAYWSEYVGDKNPANVWVVDEGKIAAKEGSERKREIAALMARMGSRKKWKGKDLRCLGGQNCETYARGIASGKKQYKSRLAMTAGAGITGGGAAGGGTTAGALSLIDKDKKKVARRKRKSVVRNVLQVINGGPGSGHHGHKGIPGQQGGSLPEGQIGVSRRYVASPGPRQLLVDTPQAAARRRKTVFTKASKTADTFSEYADDLERKRRKLFPISKSEALRLFEAHQKASENYRSSADQATLVKGSTIEEQKARLSKADYHEAMARKYAKKLNRKIPGADFLKSAGKTFARELTGGLSESLGKAGADVARESIRGGFKAALEGKNILEAVKRSSAGEFKEVKSRAFGDARKSSEKEAIAEEVYKQRQDEYKQALKRLHAVGGKVKETTDKESRALIQKLLKDKIDLEGMLAAKGVVRNSAFEVPTANLAGRVRREMLHDREYLVAPLTMIVPGVLAGSKGPLLYPVEEVSKNPSAWNGMPIVVNHPMKDGTPVEARDPGILEKYQIGTVFNTRYDGKLVAEGWFDVDRTRKTNIGIYEQLVNNKPIELSTGLYTDNEPFEGVWNGRRYEYVARNYRPDHLAILLGSRGACSIKDGCGVLINDNSEVVANIIHKIKGGYQLVSHKGKNLGKAKSKEAIQKRMRQVEYFKHVKNEAIRPEVRLVLNGLLKVTERVGAGFRDRVSKAIREGVGLKLAGRSHRLKTPKVKGPSYKFVAEQMTKAAKKSKPVVADALESGKPPKQIYKAEIAHPHREAAKAVGKSLGIAAGSAARGAKKVAGTAKMVAGRHPKATKRLAKGAALAGAVGGAYQLGKRKGKKKPTTNLSNTAKKRLRQAGGFGGGLAAGAAGTAVGAAKGAALGSFGGPIGTGVGALVGGGIGGALGTFGARKVAQKLGGQSAARAADVGGLVGTFATPSGVVRGAGRLAGRAGLKGASRIGARAAGRVASGARAVEQVGVAGAKPGAARVMAKGANFAGRSGVEGTSYLGAEGAAQKAFGKKKRKPTQNAWTAIARQKSIETRRRKKLHGKPDESDRRLGTGTAVAIGAIGGRVGSRLLEPEIDKATMFTRKKIIQLLKAIGRRVRK